MNGNLSYFKYHNSMAIVRYNTKEEAQNEQNKLNFTIGNSTIVTQFISENEVK